MILVWLRELELFFSWFEIDYIFFMTKVEGQWDETEDSNLWDASGTGVDELCQDLFWDLEDFIKALGWWIGVAGLHWGGVIKCSLCKLTVNAGLDVMLTEHMVDMVDEEGADTIPEDRGLTMCIA